MVFDTKFSLQSFLTQVSKLTLNQRISIEKMGFGNVLQIPNQNLRRHQLVELMERWCCEKQAFMLRPGAITISLMDVALILGLRVIGDPVGLKVAPITELERDFGASVWCRKLTVASVKERLESLGEQDDENFIRSFLLFTFGTLLFPNTNGKVDSRYLILLQDLEKVSKFAWGAAVLSDLFYYLSQRKKNNFQCIGGCLILLQIWCYEHIKVGRPICLNTSFPRSCRWEKVSRGYIIAHNDRGVFPALFRNLEHNQVLWELEVSSRESEMNLVKELLESKEYSSSDVCVEKEDNTRTNSEMVEQWVDLATESSTAVGMEEEQEYLVRQPQDADMLLEVNNDSTPSTSYHFQQKEQQRVSHINQEVFIENNTRTNSEMVEQWVNLVTESSTDVGINEEQEGLVRQPPDPVMLFEEHHDSTLSTSYHMQEVQKEQQRQQVFIISDDGEGNMDACSEEHNHKLKNKNEELRKLKNQNEELRKLKNQNDELRKLKNENEELRKENLELRLKLDNLSTLKNKNEELMKQKNEDEELRKEILELRLKLDNVRRESRLSTDRILDRLEKIILDEDVDSVLVSDKCNSKEQL